PRRSRSRVRPRPHPPARRANAPRRSSWTRPRWIESWPRSSAAERTGGWPRGRPGAQRCSRPARRLGARSNMSPQEGAVIGLAVVGTISAFRLVSTRNVVHAALYLVVTLAMVGGVYLVLAAEFLAWVQVVIYVGAIVVLLLFSLMLTKAPIGRDTLDNQQRGLAALVAAAVLGGLLFLVSDAFPHDRIHP